MGGRGGVTMHDVARRAGVSVMTVSNVLNGYRYIRPETKQRVEAAIDELDYRVNLTARHLRLGRTGMIGLAVPELTATYFACLADAVIRAADEAGLSVLIEQTGSTKERELRVLRGLRRELTDGLIFQPQALDQHDVDALKVTFPMVVLGERIVDAPVDHVMMANVEGARAATEHLIRRGRRRIALLGWHQEEHGPSSSRTAGYRQALTAAGIDYDPALVAEAEPWRRSTGAAALEALLDSGQQIDGVFAMNDSLALGALHVLHERRIEVPGQVAVIGFDNTADAAFAVPTLSTVGTGQIGIAATAVRLLRQRIDQQWESPPRLVVADYRVVERDSTGPESARGRD